jgi:NAD(P)-dependent dehydrogenase (short-subunit alcohol dehydrogenase family)
VIITGRDATRGQDAATAIRRESGADSASFLQADHSTVGGNRQLAGQVRAAYPGLDILINNVGGLYETRWETADGYEATLAMNFVGPYAPSIQGHSRHGRGPGERPVSPVCTG